MAYNNYNNYNNNGRVNQHLPQTQGQGAKNLTALVKSDKIIERFNSVLNNRQKTSQFLAGVVAAVNTNPLLAQADPNSVLASAMVAATLNLDVIPGLGLAALVPYAGKCQFQIMTNGYVQLALRSGQYKSINVTEVYKDEFESYDPITGEVSLRSVDGGDRDNERMENIVGYAAYIEFTNGFRHIEYWKKSRVMAHGHRYSKSFGNRNGLWQTDPHAMAKKTVLKSCLRRWGILSVEMLAGIKEDQKAFDNMDDKEGQYIDNIPEEPIVVKDSQPNTEQKEEPKAETRPEPEKTKEDKAKADQEAELKEAEAIGAEIFDDGPENFDDGGFDDEPGLGF